MENSLDYKYNALLNSCNKLPSTLDDFLLWSEDDVHYFIRDYKTSLSLKIKAKIWHIFFIGLELEISDSDDDIEDIEDIDFYLLDKTEEISENELKIRYQKCIISFSMQEFIKECCLEKNCENLLLQID